MKLAIFRTSSEQPKESSFSNQKNRFHKMYIKDIPIPSAASLISAAATAVLIRSVTGEFVPEEVRQFISSKLRRFLGSFSSQFTIVIEEFEGFRYNDLFRAAELYLQPTLSPNTRRFRVNMPAKETKISVSIGRGQEIFDTFNGVLLKWKLISKKIRESRSNGNPVLKSEIRFYELSCNKKHKNIVISTYFPYLIEKAKEAKEKKKTLKLFTLKVDRFHRRGTLWESVNLNHPSKFENLAMDTDTKLMIQKDLKRFVERKEFYGRVGKAWKRGYLLYGPPGTGKSSLIAAMANFLNFDIYDLELENIKSNSILRKLLICTANRSILVVEDIDCSIELQNRNEERSRRSSHHHRLDSGSEVTLSGLLNFIDGLWSSCGAERIIVVTTNHKEKLDPALLRPGRMDVHINMPYCSPSGFKMLASTYLGLTHHELFSAVEQLMETLMVTPAEIGEELLKFEEPETALRGLIDFLARKKKTGAEQGDTQSVGE